MKSCLILLLLAAGLASLPAQTISVTTNWASNLANNGTVPDDDLNGLVDSRVVSGTFGQPIVSLEVTLNLSGGFNGDIYAYLFHDGVMSVLLDRVGTPANSGYGYSDSGFDVTLSDAAASSIHNYQDNNPSYNNGSVTGIWQPDGGGLSVFQGMAGDGTWTLFLADENSGGVMNLNSWGLDIQTAPEPSAIALLAVSSAGFLFLRCRKSRYPQNKPVQV